MSLVQFVLKKIGCKMSVQTINFRVSRLPLRPSISEISDSLDASSRNWPLRALCIGLAAASLALLGCSAGDEKSANETTVVPNPTAELVPSPNADQMPQTLAAPLESAFNVKDLQFAQVSVIPALGKSWEVKEGKYSLNLIGNRKALMMVNLNTISGESPWVEGRIQGQSKGKLNLAAPSELPKTAGDGPAFATNLHSVTLPKDWLQVGLELRFGSDKRNASTYSPVTVGFDPHLNLTFLPIYLFGANPDNTISVKNLTDISQQTRDDLLSVLPIANLSTKASKLGKIEWPNLVIPPNGSAEAKLIKSSADTTDTFAIHKEMMNIVSVIKSMNGTTRVNELLYGMYNSLDSNQKSEGSGNGYGGTFGDAEGAGYAVGPTFLSTVFLHEIGHALGVDHAEDAYKNGVYPYSNGSLFGSETQKSAWGFDSNRNEFVTPFLDPSIQLYQTCQETPNMVKDAAGRCYKDDLMRANGLSWELRTAKPKGYNLEMFADSNLGIFQSYMFEGKAAADSTAKTYQKTGWIEADSNFKSGYSRWDHLNDAFPMKKDEDIYSVIFTLSAAGTAEVSQFYPVFKGKGNLLETIDPSVKEKRDLINPSGGGNYNNYCQSSGCDYTLRATFSDGSIQLVLINAGFRPWGKSSDAIPATAKDSKNGKSFLRFGVNLSAAKTLSKVELLDTPKAWEAWPSNPTVLFARQL
jgi:hypothetical protein